MLTDDYIDGLDAAGWGEAAREIRQLRAEVRSAFDAGWTYSDQAWFREDAWNDWQNHRGTVDGRESS